MHSHLDHVDEPPDFIEKIANHAGVILLGSVALIFLVWIIYFSNFGALPTGETVLSDNTQIWGQFGDFVGGTLNSIFAFFSFMILIASLRLQVKELRLTRRELALTRAELASSSSTQKQQIDHLRTEAEKKDLLHAIDYILTRDIIGKDNFVIGVGTGANAAVTRNLMEMNFPTKMDVDRSSPGTYDTTCFFKEVHAIRKLDADCAALQGLLTDSPILKCAKERYGEISRCLSAKGWADGFQYLNR